MQTKFLTPIQSLYVLSTKIGEILCHAMDPNSQPKTIHPRPHTNDNCNGPRVSFNKDVHVKRIGNLVVVIIQTPQIGKLSEFH